MYWNKDFYKEINGIFDNWERYFTTVPEGFELVEKEDHKLKRLQETIKENKELLSVYEKRLTELSKTIELEEKELLSLKP